jgi:imidazoleglycerol-phosphate dehydratase
LRVRLDVGGTGAAEVETGLPVLDDLLGLLAHSARFDLELESHAGGGEAEVDAVGEALGRAFGAALLGTGAQVTLEASGRPLVVANVDLTAARIGGLRSDLLARFLEALARGGGLTLHVRLLHGEDTQHVLDAIVKALGLALAQASSSRP